MASPGRARAARGALARRCAGVARARGARAAHRVPARAGRGSRAAVAWRGDVRLRSGEARGRPGALAPRRLPRARGVPVRAARRLLGRARAVARGGVLLELLAAPGAVLPGPPAARRLADRGLDGAPRADRVGRAASRARVLAGHRGLRVRAHRALARQDRRGRDAGAVRGAALLLHQRRADDPGRAARRGLVRRALFPVARARRREAARVVGRRPLHRPGAPCEVHDRAARPGRARVRARRPPGARTAAPAGAVAGRRARAGPVLARARVEQPARVGLVRVPEHAPALGRIRVRPAPSGAGSRGPARPAAGARAGGAGRRARTRGARPGPPADLLRGLRGARAARRRRRVLARTSAEAELDRTVLARASGAGGRAARPAPRRADRSARPCRGA